MKVITVDKLVKEYGDNIVLKDISFSVEQGEIFGLLGTNGAGKTTTLEIIEGVRDYSSGTIVIENKMKDQRRGKIGVQLQSTSLPSNMKVKEAIKLFSLWNNQMVDSKYLEKLGLGSLKNKQYKSLSTGQKRRLHLALSLIGNPDILILDEPTAGLDVEGRVALHQEIRQLKDLGKTIVIASHDMAEVEDLCDNIAILKDGNIVFIGSPSKLIYAEKEKYRVFIRFSEKPSETILSLLEKLVKSSCEGLGQGTEKGYVILECEILADGIIEISEFANAQSIMILDIKIEQSSLEQRFMEIAREGLA